MLRTAQHPKGGEAVRFLLSSGLYDHSQDAIRIFRTTVNLPSSSPPGSKLLYSHPEAASPFLGCC